MKRLLNSPALAHVSFYKTEKARGRFAINYSPFNESKG